MSKWFGLVLVLGILAESAFAAEPVTVKCETTWRGRKQVVELKLDARGEIVRWDARRVVKAHPDGLFGLFVEDPEESAVEYSRSFKAPNGYAIVVLGTTADEQSIGVNLKAKKGFYSYRDTGSGSGNFKLTMTCARR